MNIEKLIKTKLDEYLEFDSKQIFNDENSSIRIFGGAIRDIISHQKIWDVDILCGYKSLKDLEMVLWANGYIFMKSLNGKDLQNIYTDIKVIAEPRTWVKGSKIVQIIRPTTGTNMIHVDEYDQIFKNLISNVDLSCCGVSWDGKNLYEDYQGAIVHCQNKVFSVNKNATMYSEKRGIMRISKLFK